MRKINLFILLLAGILFFGCSSAGNQKGKQEQKETATISENSQAAPEHLTYESFKEKVWDFEANPKEWVYKGSEPCIIDFYATWCQPCKMVAPIMEELAKNYAGKLKIYKIDTDAEQQLSYVFQINSIPSVLFVPASGQPMKQTGAMSKEYYEQVIKEFLLPQPKSGDAASQE